MGCGISKYGLADQVAPLRRKLEEFRRNDRDIEDDTPSTKQLLKDSGEDSFKSRKSASSTVLEQTQSMKNMVGCDSATKGKKGGEGGENEVERKNEEVMTVEKRDNRNSKASEEEDEEEEGRRISDYDASALWIGSPSFREYCTNDSHLEDGFDTDDNNDEEKKQNKEKREKFHASPQPNEGPEKKSIRKERKGRGFRKVFPTGRSSSVKRMFHVTSCYNPNNVSASPHHKLEKPIDKTV
ncbi:uncharacterized protein LOC130775195 [Actinidia eriantha]|uniref:uncharacterized protein LOC130775195 n=1 Tax=Actinidia eriantha TaxID=165200 RepID=UPI002585C3CC|nr:uncharacterized protein LOC130775195 [Actinidia eriantha]